MINSPARSPDGSSTSMRSKRYENAPYMLEGANATIDHEPAESTTTMFGGN